MYGEIAKTTDDNFAFSPASLHLALGMTYAGAEGETAQQMADALSLHGPGDEVHASFAGELDRWKAWKTGGTKLLVANRLFAAKDLKMERAFLELTRTRYSAPVEQLDFFRQPDPARRHINAWVEKSRRRYIKDLLPKGARMNKSIDFRIPRVDLGSTGSC
jgi:serpin B